MKHQIECPQCGELMHRIGGRYPVTKYHCSYCRYETEIGDFDDFDSEFD